MKFDARVFQSLKDEAQVTVLLNALFIGMTVPYVLAEAHPLPRGIINRTRRMFGAYEGILILVYVL